MYLALWVWLYDLQIKNTCLRVQYSEMRSKCCLGLIIVSFYFILNLFFNELLFIQLLNFILLENTFLKSVFKYCGLYSQSESTIVGLHCVSSVVCNVVMIDACRGFFLSVPRVCIWLFLTWQLWFFKVLFHYVL